MNKRHMHEVFAWGVTALAVWVWTGAASAQVRTGGTGGASSTGGASISGGSFGGSSFGGSSFGGSSFGGSSFGGSSFSGSSGFVGGGFSGSSSGGGSSFSGGSFSGSSFSGGSFSGNMSGNLSRTTGGGGAGLSGNLYQGVSNTNPFYQSYQEPLASGMGAGNQRTTFGMPMFNLSQSITGNLTGGGALGMTGGVSAVAFNPSPATYLTTPFMVGFTTASSSGFAPPPVRTLPPAVASRLQREAQQVINQSSALPSKGGIRVSVVGPAVVLQGVVSDDHERLLAEGLVRLTPGINDVVNELRVAGMGPGTPRPMPPP